MKRELTTNKIVEIIESNNIKYLSYTVDYHYNITYFLCLYYDINDVYSFDKYQYEIRSSENQINELFHIYGIDKKMMSCVFYKIN